MVFLVGRNTALLDKSNTSSELAKLRERWNTKMQEDA